MTDWAVRHGFTSRPGVCTTTLMLPRSGDPLQFPAILLDQPHGATLHADFAAVAAQLRSTLPEDLAAFFFVNTDVGSPELAHCVGKLVSRPEEFPEFIADCQQAGVPVQPRSVLSVRSHVPRTFIDCNRTPQPPAGEKTEGMTGLLPLYIVDPADVELLLGLHRSYHEVVARAHELVCGNGGFAVAMHTYAPRSVGITTIDDQIVRALRAAYVPEVYATWPQRPEVDILSQDMDNQQLAPAELVAELHQAFARASVQTAENATYRLHPATMGAHYALAYPNHVLSLEFRRDLLAEPFDPFVQMHVPMAKAMRLARPLALGLLKQLARSEGTHS